MKKKTCFVIYVGYRTFGNSATNAMYVCSTEENAKTKLGDAVIRAIEDLKTQLEANGYTYHPECLIRNTSDFCVNLKYYADNNLLEYNVFYNEIEMD